MQQNQTGLTSPSYKTCMEFRNKVNLFDATLIRFSSCAIRRRAC